MGFTARPLWFAILEEIVEDPVTSGKIFLIFLAVGVALLAIKQGLDWWDHRQNEEE